MSITAMTVREALQHANVAGRGGLSALETVLKALAEGAVYDVYAGNPNGNLTPKAKGSWCLDTSSNIWYRAKGIANSDWIAIGEHGLTADELTVLNVVAGTGEASKALILDSNGDVTVPGAVDLDGNDMAVVATAGISGVAGSFGSSVVKIGTLIKTTIFIDLTGLEGGDAGDIIGDASPGISHLGQFTVARSGALFYGQITCLETPAGGNTDIDFTSADEDTGVQDAQISGLSNLQVLLDTGAWTEGVVFEIMTGLPAVNQYLYMVDVGGTAVEYSAGKFLLEFWGA